MASPGVECMLKHLRGSGCCTEEMLESAASVYEEIASCQMMVGPETCINHHTGSLDICWGSEKRFLKFSIDPDGEVEFERMAYDFIGEPEFSDSGVILGDEGISLMLAWYFQDQGKA